MSHNASLALPSHLYPVCAPLSPSCTNHLAMQESRSRRIVAHKRPSPEQVHLRVLARIAQARSIIYEYMAPFIAADQKLIEAGKARSFPQSDWLLDTLAIYTPTGKRLSPETLDYWVKQGLLRREYPRGPYSLTSVAAILIARIAEEDHERNWYAPHLSAEESLFWCYSQQAPSAPLEATQFPTVHLPASTLLRTPWLGVVWEDSSWRIMGDMAYRWAGTMTGAEELQAWDEQLSRKIIEGRNDPLHGKEAVQQAMVQEAGMMILDQFLQSHTSVT